MHNNKIDPRDLIVLRAHVLGKSREWIAVHPTAKRSFWQSYKLWRMICRRRAGEPLAYILGHKEFFGLDFVVNPNVLIPRPDTEILVERTLKILNGNTTTVIEIGTGSGAVAVSIAKHSPDATVIATDVSSAALAVAKQNAQHHNTPITLYNDDLLSDGSYVPKNRPVMIVANLPYLSDVHFAEADESVTAFEPTLALRGGTDGLNLYTTLFSQITHHPTVTHVLCEAHDDQMDALAALAKTHFPHCNTFFHQDLSGQRRVCEVALL